MYALVSRAREVIACAYSPDILIHQQQHLKKLEPAFVYECTSITEHYMVDGRKLECSDDQPHVVSRPSLERMFFVIVQNKTLSVFADESNMRCYHARVGGIRITVPEMLLASISSTAFQWTFLHDFCIRLSHVPFSLLEDNVVVIRPKLWSAPKLLLLIWADSERRAWSGMAIYPNPQIAAMDSALIKPVLGKHSIAYLAVPSCGVSVLGDTWSWESNASWFVTTCASDSICEHINWAYGLTTQPQRKVGPLIGGADVTIVPSGATPTLGLRSPRLTKMIHSLSGLA